MVIFFFGGGRVRGGEGGRRGKVSRATVITRLTKFEMGTLWEKNCTTTTTATTATTVIGLLFSRFFKKPAWNEIVDVQVCRHISLLTRGLLFFFFNHDLPLFSSNHEVGSGEQGEYRFFSMVNSYQG